MTSLFCTKRESNSVQDGAYSEKTMSKIYGSTYFQIHTSPSLSDDTLSLYELLLAVVQEVERVPTNYRVQCVRKPQTIDTHVRKRSQRPLDPP